MNPTSIEAALSANRFSTYRNAVVASSGSDCLNTALELYEWNANLASRFFLPLHIYEVTLRNAVSEAIAYRYGGDWPTNQFFINSLNRQDRSTLYNALSDGYYGVGRLLPEIKFVWFENMLTSRHDGRIWTPFINNVFPNRPASLTPSEIRARLKNACYTIRRFRNRCGHHEPIFNNTNLNDIYPLLSESVSWRCSDTHQWLQDKESVTELLSAPII